MTENEKKDQVFKDTDDRLEAVRNFLCGYQLCLDMLNLKKYERKRAKIFRDPCDCDALLAGNEAYWRAQMFAIANLVSSMRNGREKLILYYHYIRGESIEHAADLLGVSRRTGYRMHNKGLLMASFLYERMKKTQQND